MAPLRLTRRAALLGGVALALAGCRRGPRDTGDNKSSREILEVGFLPVT